MKTKKKRNSENDRRVIVPAVIINILFLSSIVYLVSSFYDGSDSEALAADVERIEVDPGEYPGIEYETVEEALIEANSQLGVMAYGDIQTIDSGDESFVGRLFRDYEIGDELYWELGDSQTEVYLEAYNGAIIFYDRLDWFEGSLSEGQIESEAYLIANQFETLPADREGPSTSYETTFSFIENIDNESDEVSDLDYWTVRYDRVKEQITTEDHIRMMLCPNGYLGLYRKVWYMDWTGFSPTYTVSKENAELTAKTYHDTEYGDNNSVIMDTYKLIVRPNYFWHVPESPLDEEDNPILAYGLPRQNVWVVLISDDNDDQFVFHVDGKNDKIVGGDFTFEYYIT
jgi:hypothetical protein